MILGTTKVVGIFGDPVEHSFSPPMHNAAFLDLGLDFVYVPLRVIPKNLKDAVTGFRSMNLSGANVTIPHKENILPYLDKLSPISEKMGVVNTLYWEEDKLCGTTTDPYGAIQNLQNATGKLLTSERVLLLGYGGAARAIAFALAMEFPHTALSISGRNKTKAEILQDEVLEKTNRDFKFYATEELVNNRDNFDIIINTTPIGMHPHEDKSPIHKDFWTVSHIAYDIVYNPKETLFLKHAAQKKAKTINGLGMLVYQGAKSFSLWTGYEPNIPLMFATLESL
jgi:shikimate dehydrogenase